MNQACLELFDDVASIRGFFAPFKEIASTGQSSGISLYEDDDSIYLEAPAPGVKAEEIQVTFDRKGVSIEGKGEAEKPGVKYHIKSSRNFSYWIPLPLGRIDENAKVEAISKDGILQLVFSKSRAAKPLKILVKSA